MTQDTQTSEINTSPDAPEIYSHSDSDLSDLEPFHDKWSLDQSFEDMCTSAKPESEGPSSQGCQPIKEPTVDASVENTNDSAEIPSSETIQECKETSNFKECCTYLRSKLQNTLLSDQLPKESMEKMSSCLDTLEGFEDSAIDVIREFKLDKVLRKIRKLDFILQDEEFQFRQRAIDLLEKWEKLPITHQLHPTSLERQPLPKDKPKTQVIDLTDDDDAEPSVPSINTSSSIIENNEPAPSTTKDGSSLSSSSKSNQKRKSTDISPNSSDDIPTSTKKSRVNESPSRRPPSKRAKFQTHLKTEGGWLAESMDWIKKRIEENAQELTLIEKKRSDLLEENAQELALVEEKRRIFLEENRKELALVAKKRSDLLEENAREAVLVEKKRSKFLDFKKNIRDWGAQDDEVTRELEKSK